ncbi:MAG: indolepyruvate ferredoxin oxidoreductase family protein, partial [Sciscionella sp.]
SPLAGYDLQLQRHRTLLDEHGIRHVPAGNEEQAVTALMGTQMLDGYPHERYDGVVGFFYGKGPGIDRAGDALNHANFAGTSRHGAVVVLSGEDHDAKSSTMPFQQEYAFASAGMPVLYPGTVANIRTLGLHAVALSRYSGCWVALKLVSQLCDGGATVDLGQPVEVRLPALRIDGRPFTKRVDFSFFPGKNIEHERHLYDEKHAAVLAYARANRLNRIVFSSPDDTVGVISAGKSAADVRQALADLGLPPDRSPAHGIRLLEVGMPYPLDADAVRDFARGLRQVIVIEEKRDFLEQAVRAALQPLGERIGVVGKRDRDGRPLFPVHGALDADLIAEGLAPLLRECVPGITEAPRLHQIAAVRARQYTPSAGRTPNFCSGCPHSASTVLADGQVAWGAPGCGCFNTVIEQPQRHIDTMTHYGGEGLPWIGLAPFTEREHLVQHVGDGSLYHSSYLNIRWAVAAGAHMTFKVLYNSAVANTGAQQAPGSRGVAELTRGLAAEGVTRIVLVTKETGQYRRAQMGEHTTVRPARDMLTVAAELEAAPGVTVMIYDESCANERRRQQKRGHLTAPTKHVLINEAVCEACGDCGAQSNCMSLQRVDTEFGPKTQVHASSCNQDYSCLAGDCPAFVTVTAAEGTGLRRPPAPSVEQDELPDPPPADRLARPFHVYLPGVGGTGVITLNAMLAVAAQLDGIGAVCYDQTGAAQKWGPVLSSITLLPPDAARAVANKVGLGRADVVLALDEVSAVAAANLDRYDPDRTALVVNSDLFPTGEMVRDVWHQVDRAGHQAALERWTRHDRRVEVPARSLAETLFGDYMLTNVIATGAAVQAGHLPLTPTAVERAIRVNGVAVEANLQAFRVGRQWVADPTPLREQLWPAPRPAAEEQQHRERALGSRRGATYRALMDRTTALGEPTRRLLAIRIAELIDYQSTAYAERYLQTVLRVADAEQHIPGSSGRLTDAVARNLFKLMAYKDEYEVARLHLRADFAASITDRFEKPVRIDYHLSPPVLRRLGRTRKVTLGPWFRPAFRLLRAARRLRGTPLDPFARQSSRREERALIDWYEDLLAQGLTALTRDTMPVVIELAETPDLIRGYEQIKTRHASHARARAATLLARLQGKHTTTTMLPTPRIRT